MFSASLSLAAKDTPRTGKKYQGVFAVSRRGGDEKTDGRTKNACFLHRIPQENASRTPGAPLRYRASIPYTRRPSTVPNATSAKRRKTLPAPNSSNCQKRGEAHLPEKRRPLQKAQPGTPPRARKSQPKSLQCRPKATQCHSEKPRCPKATQCPQKVDITPLSKSKKPISELTGFLVVGRRIELLLRD